MMWIFMERWFSYCGPGAICHTKGQWCKNFINSENKYSVNKYYICQGIICYTTYKNDISNMRAVMVTYKHLEMHGYMLSTLATDALVLTH